MGYVVCLAADRPRMWISAVGAGLGGEYTDLVCSVKHPWTERWKTLIHMRLSSGDVDLTIYEVYVSGQDDEGPEVMTRGDAGRDFAKTGGIWNFMDSC